MSFNPQMILVVIALVWLLVLTVLFVWLYLFYSRISKKGKKESLVHLLDEVLRKEDHIEKILEAVNSRHEELEKDVKTHVQKIGLLRFNPFNDTGGDQSFILALLDAEDTGVVISSLHTRTGTRWYAKKVVHGKGVEYELSNEEQKALKSATSLNAEE